jgi:parallel beta-helix repeat protein
MTRLALAVSLVLMCAHVPAAADDLCGATIVGNLVLQHDLSCPGDGLVVGADAISINLNGFTISGQGTGVGVTVTGRTQVAVFGGTIANFAAGIRTRDVSRVAVKEVTFLDNADGIDLQQGSTGNTIRHNDFRGHTVRAIMIRGSSTLHTIDRNRFEGNRIGILVFAGVDNVVAENTFSHNTVAGIRLNVFATGNLIVLNDVRSNEVGIELLSTSTAATVGNSFVKNTLAGNACGVKGLTAGNTFRRNQFIGNTMDACL